MKSLKKIAATSIVLSAMAGVGVKSPGLFMSKMYIPVQPKVEQKTEKITNVFPVYALKDTYIFHDASLLSGTTDNISIGDTLYASDLQDGYYVVSKGLIRENDFTLNKKYVFYPIDRIKYALSGAKGLDDLNGSVISSYSLNDEVHLIGRNDYGYYLTDQNEYIKATDVMNTPYAEIVPIAVPETATTTAVATYTPPTGSGHLTPSAGVFYGPSGKETYYNLPMGGVISIAQNAGIQGNYWERADGAKMYGNYIICACGFDVRPRGTIIETSLGAGICLDTGTFAYTDPYQVDLAVTWN